MDSTKIGNKEAIALLITITFNHIILNITKTIIDTTGSASLLNILYVTIIVIIFDCIICYFLNKFPTFDLIDISNYLGGPILKWIIGILYIAYFVFFAGILLHIFASCLQIIYYQLTEIYYICLLFIIGAVISSSLNHNAIFRTVSILVPFMIFSIIFLFITDLQYFRLEGMYPIFGKGISVTFLSGLCNIFAFQGLAYIYFLPPTLKEQKQLKHITITAICWSSILLFLSITIIICMFHGLINTDELIPLYSATKYIEFGSFFRKLDPLFVLIWIMAFLCYLSITFKFSSNILKKLTHFQNIKVLNCILGVTVFLVSIWPKNYSISTNLADSFYKYSFFILIIGISFLILLSATIKQKIKRWLK